MKKLFKFFAPMLVVGVMLAGCSTPVGQFFTDLGEVVTDHSIAEASPSAIATAEKALTVTHLAYNFIGEQLLANTQPGGLLHGTTALEAKHYYDIAGDALSAADAADAVANAKGLTDAITKAQDAIAKVNDLIHPPPAKQ